MARAVGRGSSCSWVRAARITADSAHCCQASILAVWLGCMRIFVAVRTIKVGELRLSGLGAGFNSVLLALMGLLLRGGVGQPLCMV